MKCYQAKTGELNKHWYVIDATDQVVGRLAAQIAPILMGKHRPTYTPHIDTGDFVIVTNVDKVVFTGNKWQQKFYQHYTGHPGGQRDEQAWKLFQRHPERILELAVRRMMPKNKLGRHMLTKLKLYTGDQHPHQAQAPLPLEALTGRPAPAGAAFAPKPEPNAPRPKANGKPPEITESTSQPDPVEAESSLQVPPPEASLPLAPVEAELPAPPHNEPTTPPETTPGAE
jgi:large subunit ribosomal protein L13